VTEQSQAKKHRSPGQQLDLAGLAPATTGSFAPGKDWQIIRFTPARARFVCLEALNSQSGDAYTTCAEIYLVDETGKDLPREGWKVVYADSEEVGGDDGNAENIFDLQPTTFWHTQWEGAQPHHPHQIVLDLGVEPEVAGLRYLPRQDSTNGRIKDYRIFLSTTQFPGLTKATP
ncbi:MAG TPA: discoidin domain-containing protein, partial [Verrucomicrobiae bacterium]